MIPVEPILLAGKLLQREGSAEQRSPWNGKLIGHIGQATAADADEACEKAAAAFPETRLLPAWRRTEILNAVAAAIHRDRDMLAALILSEAGKPLREATLEVGRAIQTFSVAAEEARRISMGLEGLDWVPGAEGRVALERRVPIGPVLGITPFNFPINLVAHKVAPAIAAGNPILIKPAPQTPRTALALGRLVVEAGWPPAAISVLPCDNTVAEHLLLHPAISMLSFTGSAAVGWALKARVPKMRVVLELGGNAACIVHHDADLALAAEKIEAGGFAYAGQSCISVQRVFAHASIFDDLVRRVVSDVGAFVSGDPSEYATEVGPMINEAAADRAEKWIREAVARGARLHCGGQRTGTLLSPAVLSNVPAETLLASEEVFAPIVFINPYTSFEQALDLVNQSKYGLQAAVFTQSWPLMAQAWNELEVGAVLVNESTAWRADHMPYGGVKDSGTGREGLRPAIEEMTELRLLITQI